MPLICFDLFMALENTSIQGLTCEKKSFTFEGKLICFLAKWKGYHSLICMLQMKVQQADSPLSLA